MDIELWEEGREAVAQVLGEGILVAERLLTPLDEASMFSDDAVRILMGEEGREGIRGVGNGGEGGGGRGQDADLEAVNET